MKILLCPQRSPEWFRARAGRLGSSEVKEAFATKASAGEPASVRDTRLRLATEQLTGEVEDVDPYVNKDMQRGIDLEPFALRAYETLTLTLVDRVGLIQHDTLMASCSPDALVNDDGVVETKCPRPANHLAWMRAGVVPPEHVLQCRHILWITGRDWIDFVSYCDVLPPGIRATWIVRMERSSAVDEHGAKVEAFLATVDREREALIKLGATHE